MSAHPTTPATPIDLNELTAVLGPRADAVDKGHASAHEDYQEVRTSGLLSLLVPTTHGGHGGSFLEHTKAIEELATANVAIALGYNMHNVAIGSLCETADTPLPEAAEAFREWVFNEVTKHGRMFASAVSETGSGAELRRLRATYRRTDDGFVLTGQKSFVSLSRVADYYVVAARDEAGDGDEVSHFVVAVDDPGIEFGPFWDGAALRGTETAAMTLNEVEISRSRLFLGVEGMSLFKLVREPHWMTGGYMGAYLGLAEVLARYITETLQNDEQKRASSAIQADVGRLCIDIAAARAAVYTAARSVDEARGTVDTNVAVHIAKHQVGELGPRVAAEAVRLTGSRSLHAAGPIQRLLREAQFCAVMPASTSTCRAYVGKAALGYDMLDARNLNW